MTQFQVTEANLKQQAKRLRDHFAGKDIDFSHSAALEAVAKQYGYRDWNILSAMLKRQQTEVNWPTVGHRVSGTYLGHKFTGTVLKIQAKTNADYRAYTFQFDKPIDVVKSEHFNAFRQRINCFLSPDMKSVDHKNRPDNILKIIQTL